MSEPSERRPSRRNEDEDAEVEGHLRRNRTDDGPEAEDEGLRPGRGDDEGPEVEGHLRRI